MTKKQFKLYTDHIWKYREYLQHSESYFDYPWYWGLKSKFNGSPESCDAIQNISSEFIHGHYKTKQQFCKSYKNELKRLGEKIT